MSDAVQLVAELRKGNRQTVIRAELLVCARSLFTDSDKQLPERLRAALEDLQNEGSIRLPSIRNKEAWDRSTVPPLPHRISLREVSKERKQRSDATWTPEFAFASRIPASAKRDGLVAINDHFARNRGPWGRLVPYRIRSAQILKDEKAFDRLGLIEGNTICGQVPLSLIGAYNPDLPLVREDAPAAGSTLLIVENAHAYDLIASLNREMGVYRSILWGGGNRVAKRTISVLSLRRALNACQANRIEYAGDLDPEGIRIAASLHSELAQEGMTLHPASSFYRVMLEMEAFPMEAQQQPVGEAIAWLPDEFRASSMRLFERGHRVAQEVMDVAHVTEALSRRMASGS